MFCPALRSVTCLAFVLILVAWQSIDAQEPSAEKVFKGHLDAVTMGMFVPSGRSVVTVSFDQTVRMWGIDSRSELRQYTQHTGPVFSMAVSGDGTTLVTGAQDNTVRVWDLPLDNPIRSFGQDQHRVNAVALSPLEDSIVSASADTKVSLHSLTDAEKTSNDKAGHLAEVLSVAYRNDGAFFASSDADGRILLWSPYLDEPQGDLMGHDGRVGDLAFTSNNQQLVTASDDGVVRMWQLMPGWSKEVELGDHQVIDWSVAVSQAQAVCLAEGGKAFVLNLASGEVNVEYPKLDFGARAIAHAPNLSWVCLADESGQAHLLNFDGSQKAVVAAHEGSILDVAVHPDSNRFATCGNDGKVRIWGQPTSEDTTQEPIHTLQAGGETPIVVASLVFTPDQQHLLGGGADGRIHQWNISSGELVRTIDAHIESKASSIHQLVVAPNGQTVLSLGDDQTLRSFRLNDGSALQVMQHATPLRDVSVSPDSARGAVACDDGFVRVWDLNSGTLLQSFAGPLAPTVAVAYSGDGQTIVSASLDRSLRIVKPSILRAMPVHPGLIRSMALYGGGSQVLTCDEQRIVMTNLSNGAEVRPYRIRQQDAAATESDPADAVTYRQFKPTAVAIRPDNQRVVGGTEEGEVLVWNVNDGETPLLSLHVDDSVTAIAYSSDNQKLAVATASNLVHLFGPAVPGSTSPAELTLHQRIKTDAAVTDVFWAKDNQSIFASLDHGKIEQWNYAGLVQRRQMNHGGAVYGVAVTEDGKRVISCSADQTVRVWDATTGQQKADMRGHNGAVHAIAISDDETFAVTSGADGTIRLWDIVGGRQLKQLTRFDDTMYTVAIDPTGQLIAAAGADRKVHLLDLISGEERRTLEGHSDFIHCAQFDAAGERLLSYGYAGHLKIWNTSDGSLLYESRVGMVGNYAQFSPDGHQIMLSNGDGTARVIAAP